MDGFDDLLAPTRDALERNPFADPFARPESPDPWKTFHPTSSSAEDTSTDAFGEARGSTPTLDDPGVTGTPAAAAPPPDTELPEWHARADPLESAKVLQDDEEETARTRAPVHEQEPSTPTDDHAAAGEPKSPGFRESVSTGIEDTLAPTPTEEKKQPTPPRVPSPPLAVNVPPPSSVASPPLTSPTGSSSSIIGHAPRSSTASVSSPFSQPKPFVSPLEQPQSLEHSFSGLALGGESINGWQSMGQGSQSAFVGTAAHNTMRSQEDDDDDDDDKPILQARMSSLERAQHAGSTSVPVSTVNMTVHRSLIIHVCVIAIASADEDTFTHRFGHCACIHHLCR